MKKTIITLCMLAGLCLPAAAGEISAGAVPGSINYQGRLERDSAPLTGVVHITFRIYDALTGGNVLWTSSELTVTAAQGIFNSNLVLPWTVLSGIAQRYLEVQVEGDILTPREAVSSVAYALVAKKLEDGGSVSLSTLAVNGNIFISSQTGVSSGCIIFPSGNPMCDAGVGTVVGGITASGNATVSAGTAAVSNIIFLNHYTEIARFDTFGRLGIGNLAPATALDVVGDARVSGAIYGSAGGTAHIGGNLDVNTGRISGVGTGGNEEFLSLGETDNVIKLGIGGAERMRLHSDGSLLIGLVAPALAAPFTSLQAAGVIYSTSGVRGTDISVGAYNATSLSNEIRTQTNVPLLLQQNSAYNVGIGTSTPLEKLHVQGSIRAEKGIIASTAAISGDATVGGNFSATNPHANVFLTSTTIYGTLTVTNGMNSLSGPPAYLSLDNVFAGKNAFQGQVTVSSNVLTQNRLGAGLVSFGFPEANYLQVGDPALSTTDGLEYIAGGAGANAVLKFYRGAATEAARIETQNGTNLATVVGGVTKTLTDANYHRIQNSVVWISTGYNTTPAIFVSSSGGSVGMGTSVLDPNARLTVQGNIRISTAAAGQHFGIVFEDGTSMYTSSQGSVGNMSSNNDAIVKADADLNGTGDVLLMNGALVSLVAKSGGNVGIGALNPVSLLNIQGGDLVLGTPVQGSYSSNGVEDLIVAGNVVVDGGIVQRSATPVQFYSIISAGNVFLSTATGSMTRIGSDTVPAYTLDVTGNIRASTDLNILGNIQTGGVTRISSAGDWSGNTIAIGKGGTNSATGLSGNSIMVSNGSAIVQGNTGGANTLLHGNLAFGAVALNTADVSNTLPIGNGGTNSAAALTANAIMVSNGSAIVQGAQGTATTVLHGNAAGAPTYGAVGLAAGGDVSGILPVANGGTGLNTLTSHGLVYGNAAGNVGVLAEMSDGQLAIGHTGNAPTLATLAGTVNRVTVANGAGSITLSLPQDIHTGAVPQFAGVTAAYLKPAADSVAALQLRTSGGANVLDVDTNNKRIGINNAAPGADLDVTGAIKTTTFQMTSGANNNYVLASDGTGNATWKSIAAAGIGDNWGSDVVNTDSSLTGNGTTGSHLGLKLNNANTWTVSQTFSGGLSGALSGNATTATTATSFSGSLAGDVTGTQGATSIANLADSHLATIATAGKVSNSATTATSGNTINTIVARNGSGNFSAATITATTFSGALSGNADTATTATTATNIVGGGAYYIPYQTGSGATAMLAPSTNGYVLTTHNGVSAPTWATLPPTDLSNVANGPLSVGNGGTGNGGVGGSMIMITDVPGTHITGMSYGFTGSFQIVSSTITSPSCYTLTFDRGILTTKAAVTCN